MVDDLDELGPIDYLVVEFPGSRMTGEGLPILVDLVDRGIIRILDLEFVKRELDGSVVGMTIRDFDHDGTLDLAVFEGSFSGLLDKDDVNEAASLLQPGDSAGIVIYREPLGGAVRGCAAPGRCPGGGHRADPGRGHHQRTRRHRARGLSHRPTTRRERSMPGLIRGVARVAVVAGTATAVSNRVSRRQANRWATKDQQQYDEQQQQYEQQQYAQQQQQQAYQQQQYAQQQAAAQAPPELTMDEKIAQIQKLGELRDQGLLTEDEFAAQKAKLLG